MSYSMFSFENRDKVISNFIQFDIPKPKATILKYTPNNNIVYPSLLKNTFVDNEGLVKDKILLTQYSKTLNKNHYSNYFTNK